MTTKINIKNNIKCSELIEFLDDYVDNQLSPSQRQVFDDHLAGCQDCVAYLDSYKKSVRLLNNLSDDEQALEDAPEDLVNAIIAARLKTTKTQTE